MKPTELEALELINLFFDEKLQGVMGVQWAENFAKRHAMTMTEKLMKQATVFDDQNEFEYWKEVKEEIKNFKR